jgi:hypothetical protein
MLMPQRPDDNAPIWTALRQAVVVKRDFLVVRAGIAAVDPGASWTDDEADRFVLAMRAAPLRWVGARHGVPLGPHFAIREAVGQADDHSADLVELVLMRFSGDGDGPAAGEALYAISVAAAALSVARPDLNVLRVPLALSGPLPDGVTVAADGTTVVDLRVV